MLDKEMQRLLDALVHTPALAGERSPRTAPLASQRLDVDQLLRVITGYGMTAFGGGFNWSAQHSNLCSEMECGHETATSHLILGSPTV
jgi:hypothetical protein